MTQPLEPKTIRQLRDYPEGSGFCTPKQLETAIKDLKRLKAKDEDKMYIYLEPEDIA